MNYGETKQYAVFIYIVSTNKNDTQHDQARSKHPLWKHQYAWNGKAEVKIWKTVLHTSVGKETLYIGD